MSHTLPPCSYHTGWQYHKGQLQVKAAYHAANVHVFACELMPLFLLRGGPCIVHDESEMALFPTQQMPAAVTCHDRWMTLISTMHHHRVGRTNGEMGQELAHVLCQKLQWW